MLKNLNNSDLEFKKAKNTLLTGLTLGNFLWMGLFIGIAGEWFLMWQSKTWNAQSTAFSLSIVFLLIRLNIASKED
jgi:predicted small integral membrane protein